MCDITINKEASVTSARQPVLAAQHVAVEDEQFPADVKLRYALRESMLRDPPPTGPNAGIFAVERMATMAEPSTSAAGGFALWKLFGGLAGFAALAAFLAAIVSMCMMTPRNAREWAVGIISTVMFSLCGGAWAVLKLGLLIPLPADPQAQYLAVLTALGVVFACGLPGWAVVRAVFTWLIKRDGKDIGELAADARADVVKAVSP